VLRHVKEAKKSLSARRTSPHPKIAAVTDAIRPLLDVGEKVLVFCHHRATASELLGALELSLRAESISRAGPV
jgi:ERCC4-related helicase